MKQKYIIGTSIFIIFLVAGALFVWQKKAQAPAPIIPTPPVTTPTLPTPTPEPRQPEHSPNAQTSKTLAGWKTYENKEFGFEISYPGEWFVYDKAKWEKDNIDKECGASIGFVHLMNGILFSRKDLGKCVDYYPGPPSSEIATQVHEGESPLNYYINEPGRKIIIIDGEKAEKVPTLRNTTALPRNNFTTIGFNHKKKSYTIYLSQTDRNGHYDPILDQILSTFRFLK